MWSATVTLFFFLWGSWYGRTLTQSACSYMMAYEVLVVYGERWILATAFVAVTTSWARLYFALYFLTGTVIVLNIVAAVVLVSWPPRGFTPSTLAMLVVTFCGLYAECFLGAASTTDAITPARCAEHREQFKLAARAHTVAGLATGEHAHGYTQFECLFCFNASLRHRIQPNNCGGCGHEHEQEAWIR